ncbi:MAG: class I SAM-dependent methyltransferase [Planctomycetota bacterium]
MSDPTQAEIMEVLGGLYAEEPLGVRLTAKYRPLIAPIDQVVSRLAECRSVLDIGCGQGTLLLTLNAFGSAEEMRGIDSSASAIQTAARVASKAEASGCTFECLDAADDWCFDPVEGVGMVDLMHHLPPEVRGDLIRKAAAQLRPGGVLVYKDMCRRPVWRMLLNRMHDLAMARQWIDEEPVANVIAWATEVGLELIEQRRINMFWYGHDLLVFRKPSGDSIASE